MEERKIISTVVLNERGQADNFWLQETIPSHTETCSGTLHNCIKLGLVVFLCYTENQSNTKTSSQQQNQILHFRPH